MGSLEDDLSELDESSLRRRLRWVGSGQGREILLDGERVVNFASNDYLGLASHPEIIAAMKAGVDEWGVGSGASRLITGSMTAHGELEEYIAELKGCEAALSFSTGYAASVATVSGLMGKGDTIILDKLAHASLIDGARLSGATVRVFPHNGLGKLERLLEGAVRGAGRVLVVTESVFSMDGDVALLEEIISLKDKYGAMLLVDEAHGLGVYGERGLGLIEHLGVGEGVDIHMGTLGKSAGVAGGYIAGSRALIDLVVNKGRAFIYSTAPPPAQAVAAKRALEILTSGEGGELKEKLWGNMKKLTSMLADVREIVPTSAIIPWHVGEADDALELSNRLLEEGVFVPAIRYPTVPRGTARLRITLTASHSEADLIRLAEVLAESEGR
ncbi:MAG: 8-amino-7-oxononanoate synthase [Akkermansiaceae bacterium]